VTLKQVIEFPYGVLTPGLKFKDPFRPPFRGDPSLSLILYPRFLDLDFWDFCLFTVRAATSFARLPYRPERCAERLICSYCLWRLELAPLTCLLTAIIFYPLYFDQASVEVEGGKGDGGMVFCFTTALSVENRLKRNISRQ
jgi:hypothetical protein